MTTNCGCPGVWSITWYHQRTNQNYTDSVSGYEFDDPYLVDSGATPGIPGSRQYRMFSACDSRRMGVDGNQWTEADNASIVSKNFTKDDPNCNSNLPKEKYDCLNGQCVLASQFDTPGIFDSLATCQTNCGVSSNTCPPGKVCLEQSEYSEITSKLSQLHNLIC